VATISRASLNEDISDRGKIRRDTSFLILGLPVQMMKQSCKPDSHRTKSDISIFRIQHSHLGVDVTSGRSLLESGLKTWSRLKQKNSAKNHHHGPQCFGDREPLSEKGSGGYHNQQDAGTSGYRISHAYGKTTQAYIIGEECRSIADSATADQSNSKEAFLNSREFQ